MKRLTKNLIDNSIEAFILALETINRPSVRYRTEAFCFLFCNSWELLMKAKILSDGNKIFYRKKRKQTRRSLSLDDCLDYIFMFENDPIKLNIKRISELRNNAMHLVVPFVPPDIMGLFQAGVLNYPKMLQYWFSITLSEQVPLGMMALVYDFDPEKHSLEYTRMRRKLPAETVRWITDFQQDIRRRAAGLGNNAMQFYIPIDLKLAIIRNPNKADIVLSSSTTGEEALVIEVPKDIDRTHPHRAKEVIELVNQKLGGKLIINIYDILCINKIYSTNHKTEFYYKSKHWSPLYSDKFVEWIIRKAEKDPNFFNYTRSKARSL